LLLNGRKKGDIQPEEPDTYKTEPEPLLTPVFYCLTAKLPKHHL
jgi:hypothetical protein